MGAFMKTLGLVLIIVLAFVVPVRAAQVYSGCQVPSATPRHLWYINPVYGRSPAAGGDGSPANPWNSLTAVIGGAWGTFGFTVPGYKRPLLSSVPYAHFTAGKFVNAPDQVGGPPVQPGDTIYLMSGKYGDIALGNYELPTTNSDWVTVQAAPGQTPVFSSLYIRSTTKWVFKGIKVQSLQGSTNNNALVTVSDQGASFPTADIMFENMDISSADTTPGWTQANWISWGKIGFAEVGSSGPGVSGTPYAGGVPYTRCVSMTGSHIHNVRQGALIMGNNSLFSGNEIDHFGDDGLDYAANNIAITKNYEHDNFSVGDGNHEDAMQGQNGPIAPGVPYNTFSNILIDSNKVVRQTEPALPFATYLQGIDAFDEDWTNMTVTNNTIVTSACWGMELSSIHNSLVAGNTVLDDGSPLGHSGCTVALAVGGNTHEGPASSNTRVSNNLANQVWLWNQGEVGMSADHNVALFPYNGQGLNYNLPMGATTPGGTVQTRLSTGLDAYGNLSFGTPLNLSIVFKTWSPSTGTYDLHLHAGSPAIGRGDGLPATDITGAARMSPLTVGAYGYPN